MCASLLICVGSERADVPLQSFNKVVRVDKVSALPNGRAWAYRYDLARSFSSPTIGLIATTGGQPFKDFCLLFEPTEFASEPAEFVCAILHFLHLRGCLRILAHACLYINYILRCSTAWLRRPEDFHGFSSILPSP